MLHSLDFLFILLLLGIFDPTELINGIRQLYKTREGWLSPFPWCEEFQFFLGNIFTRLKVVRRKKTRGEITDVFVDMSSILDPYEECSAPRTVLIEGEPGMRKTTYCKKVRLRLGHQKASTSRSRLHSIQSMAFWCLGSHWWATSAPSNRWRSQITISFYWYWMDWMSYHPVNCRFFWINWRKNTPQMPHSCNRKTRNWKRGKKMLWRAASDRRIHSNSAYKRICHQVL